MSTSAGRMEEMDAIRDLVGRYFEQFACDPTAAALFYGEPATLFLPDRLLVFNDRISLESYLRKSLAALKRHGYSHTDMEGPRTKLLNPATALHGVVAVRMKVDGTVIERLGVTYLLRKEGGRWLIYGGIATDADKLISPD